MLKKLGFHKTAEDPWKGVWDSPTPIPYKQFKEIDEKDMKAAAKKSTLAPTIIGAALGGGVGRVAGGKIIPTVGAIAGGAIGYQVRKKSISRAQNLLANPKQQDEQSKHNYEDYKRYLNVYHTGLI
jgi:uncharacterized protein YcfJ